MLRLLFQDFFRLPLHLFSFHFLKKWMTKWEGQKPTLAMLFKFYRDSDFSFQQGQKLVSLNFKSIKKLSRETSFYQGQEIRELNNDDMALLKKSSLSLYPHEVTVIRIVNAQNEKFTSKIYHGGPYMGLDSNTIRKEIRRLSFLARKKGLIIEEVEVAHTHPAVEAMSVNEKSNESAFFFNGLSFADKQLGQRLAPFIDYPLRLSAISPVAHYSCLY